MAQHQWPNNFVRSQSHFEEYPKWLVRRQDYGFAYLSQIYSQLLERVSELLVQDVQGVFILDIQEDESVDAVRLESDSEVEEWLGDTSPTHNFTTKKDPKCRFV
jgi:tRNA G10  N-methylase Trm11